MATNVLVQIVSFAARLKVHIVRLEHLYLVSKFIIIKPEASKALEGSKTMRNQSKSSKQPINLISFLKYNKV